MAASQATTSNQRQQELQSEQTINEGNLSQRMQDLSTSTTKQQTIVQIKDLIPDLDQVPSHLEKRAPSLKEMISETLSTMAIPISNEKIQELRKIGLLMYRIKLIQLYQDLWTTYLKAGTGRLVPLSQQSLIYSLNQPIWPKKVKESIISKVKPTSAMTDRCQNFVQQSLEVLHIQLQQYQHDLDLIISQYSSYSFQIQQAWENYLKQHLHHVHHKVEHEIQLVHYDYHIRALKLEYLRHQPNSNQQQWMKQLCQEKHDQETAEQEYDLLQKQIAYYSLPAQSFDASTLAPSSFINSIEGSALQEQFRHRFKQVAEEARARMFDLYLKTGEQERAQCRENYSRSVKKMWSAQHTKDTDHPLSRIMIELIDERCKKISERIQCIYRYKESCIGLESK